MIVQREIYKEGQRKYIVIRKEKLSTEDIGQGLGSFLYNMYVEKVYKVSVILADSKIERELRKVFCIYEDEIRYEQDIYDAINSLREGLKDTEVILGNRDSILTYESEEGEEGYLFLDEYVFDGGKGNKGELDGDIILFNTERYWKVLDRLTSKNSISEKLGIKR